MKKQIIIHSESKPIILFVLKMSGSNIKDVYALYQKEYETTVISFLKGFSTKMIDYSRFMEKCVETAKNDLKIDYGITQVGYGQNSINFSRDIKNYIKLLEYSYGCELWRVTWNDIKRSKNKK